MRFIYGKENWTTMERGQENCYLLTNGLGGYSSLTITGSMARNDHALLMACTKAPDCRFNIVSRLDESVVRKDGIDTISTQQFVNHTKNREGFQYLNSFKMDDYPVWVCQAGGVEIYKELVMEYGKNTLAVRYQIQNREENTAVFTVTPCMQFVPKGASLSENQSFQTSEGCIESANLKLQFFTNGKTTVFPIEYETDLYYLQDARDGRPAAGVTASTHKISFELPAGEETQCLILYRLGSGKKSGTEATDQIGKKYEMSDSTLAETINDMFRKEKSRLEELVQKSKLTDEIAVCLTKSADQFLVDRASTGGKTIIAGYPFFGDWGRDTMIAMLGICIDTNRFEEAKEIFRTFMKYLRQGIMPNMFPEDGVEPFYNTVDASLLFIAAVNEYYEACGDLNFVREAWSSMEEIIKWYRKGTDYHIHMDKDGLIMAGGELEQVTWMDVRIGDILPTPRHGKPVEVNAYWYHDLMVMEHFGHMLQRDKEAKEYSELAQIVKKSFCEKFWNEEEGCLLDTVSENDKPVHSDFQIRCNQIWAVSLSYGMLSQEKEKKVVDKVFTELYTPYGLRSLSPRDPQFHPVYGGSQFNRDLAYHQGTVWAFPLGGYYLAYLKVHGYSKKAVDKVNEQLSALEPCLKEGCIGQIAEIYDGLIPAVSRGCFAQAWSVGELLRVYRKLFGIQE